MASTDDIFTFCDGDLHEISSALKSGRLSMPVSALGLSRIVGSSSVGAAASLNKWSETGLNAKQIAWGIDLILKARQRIPAQDEIVELVLTGPESPGIVVRDTGAVVHELFARAEQSVLVVGYALHQGRAIFRSLADRMVRAPHISVQLFFDIQRRRGQSKTVTTLVRDFVKRFKADEWPDGSPTPEVFYYPASLDDKRSARSCLHSKCVIVDCCIAFVSSANFTDAAHNRNIETGVLIRSPALAARLAQHFQGLAGAHVLERII